MGFVERDGVRLFYTLDGPDGAPFLMLSNSLGCTHEMWTAQLAAFSVKYRIIRYDRRGHGQSSSPPGPYSLDDLGRDVLAIMDAAGAKKVNGARATAGETNAFCARSSLNPSLSSHGDGPNQLAKAAHP